MILVYLLDSISIRRIQNIFEEGFVYGIIFLNIGMFVCHNFTNIYINNPSIQDFQMMTSYFF